MRGREPLPRPDRARPRHIYIENQYFTSQRIGAALAKRLAAEQGPEIVLVLRLLSHGWLEELTMQCCASASSQSCSAHDRGGRLHVYYPHTDGLEEGTCIDVHSKLMIVDDAWLRVGSANLCNRSMRFDSECDLTLEARGREDVGQRYGQFAMGCSPSTSASNPDRVRARSMLKWAPSARPSRSSAAGRAAARGRVRRHAPEVVLNIASLADPEQPVAHGSADDRVRPRAGRAQRRPWLKVAFAALLLIALAGAWRFTPLAEPGHRRANH